MLIDYLVRHRVRVSLLDVGGLKYVAKRLLLGARLLQADRLLARLRRRGARISPLVMINRVEFEGRLSNFSLGQGSFIGQRTTIQLHAPVAIGEHVAINEGVRILTGSHTLDDPAWRLKVAPVRIGNYAWIATDSMILPGVTIGEGAVVAAGSIVTRDVAPFAVVGGNPAVLIRMRKHNAFTYSPARLSAVVEAWMGK